MCFAVEHDLLWLPVSYVDDAHEMYNDYAFRLCFSVMRGKRIYSFVTKIMKMKKFQCSKATSLYSNPFITIAEDVELGYHRLQ